MNHIVQYKNFKLLNIPISIIAPKEIIYFSSNLSKEKFVIACSDSIYKHMKF